MFLATVFSFVLVSCGHCADVGVEWDYWKSKYNKVYGETAGEELSRRQVWAENFELVEKYNRREDINFKLKMNSFADQVLQYSPPPNYFQRTHARKRVWKFVATDTTIPRQPLSPQIPKSFDWRNKGVVTKVKNQGVLGSVEAFAATECVESYHAIKTGNLINLSVQETGDCCQYSFIKENLFECIHGVGGLCANGTYISGHVQCNNASCTPVAQVQGTKAVDKEREDLLLKAVLGVPVMVAVDASHISFQLYASGVYDEPNCSTQQLNHMLQVVGYSLTQDGIEYWICKNSWGESWGMNGYILMKRNVNQCGIAELPLYPY